MGINCGDCDGRTARAGPGGAYRFELLKPGKWQVVLRESEIYSSSTTVTSYTTGTPIDWSCEVYDRQTTTYDLLLDE